MSKLTSGPVERNRYLTSKLRCCPPEVDFLPMGYRGNPGDGSDVTPTLSIITPDDGCYAFFPSLLCKTEISLLDLSLEDPTQFILSALLDLFLVFFNFSLFFGLGNDFFAGRKSQCSWTYGSRFSRNTHKGADQAFLLVFQKNTSTSHLTINFHRSMLL